MGSVNLVVIVESARSLITSDGNLNEFHIPSIIAVAAALGECTMANGSLSVPLISFRRRQVSSIRILLGPT